MFSWEQEGGWVENVCMLRAFKLNCPPSVCCAWVSTGMRRLDNWGGAKGQRWSLGLERNWEFLADTSCSPVLYPPTQFSGPLATSSFLCRIMAQKQACTIGQMCVHQYKVKAHTDESGHLLCFAESNAWDLFLYSPVETGDLGSKCQVAIKVIPTLQ